jgi:hypothetical protein
MSDARNYGAYPEAFKDGFPDRWRGWSPNGKLRYVLWRPLDLAAHPTAAERIERLHTIMQDRGAQVFSNVGVAILNEFDTQWLGRGVISDPNHREKILQAVPKRDRLDVQITGIKDVRMAPGDPQRLLRLTLGKKAWYTLFGERGMTRTQVGVPGDPIPEYANVGSADNVSAAQAIVNIANEPDAGIFPLIATALRPSWYDLSTSQPVQ